MRSMAETLKIKNRDYHNTAFAGSCKDAVRAFNGTPVCELPPPCFTGSGVYAIYCTAKKGIYEQYGNKVNRMGYNVPIYVGKAVPTKCSDNGLNTLSCHEQLGFWQERIKRSLGFAIADFLCRFYGMESDDARYIDGVYRIMLEIYHPVWNSVFAACGCPDDFILQWRQVHSERFCSKADKASQAELRRLLEVARWSCLLS